MQLRNVDDFYPLAPMQQGMLFHTLAAQKPDIYCQQASWALGGELDAETLADAWRNVIGRHAILRTRFLWIGVEEPVQVVQSDVELPLLVQDWRGSTPGEQDARLEEFLSADRLTGFDLTNAPVMRLALLRIADDVHRLVWTYHHILLDGWSANRVFREVMVAYDCLAGGEAPEFSPPRPFRNYIAWLRRQDLTTAEAYWRRELAGFRAATSLAVDRKAKPEPDRQENVRTEIIHLKRTESDGLRELARRNGLTLNSLVQVAWGAMLSRYSGDHDVVFGATVLGRPAELDGAGDMVGLFINTLPVRMRFESDAPLLEWLKEFQANQAEARQYDYTPLSDIQSWSEVRGEARLFESILVFANYDEQSSAAPDGSLTVRDFRAWESANYALNAFAEPRPELLLGVVYDRHRFDVATIRRLLGHWRTLLEEMLMNPECRIGDLALASADERSQILLDWNDTDADYADDVALHEMFERQVARTPDAVSVVSEGGELSYRALNDRANQLARHLRARGVGPGVFVGAFMARSPDLVGSLLAILKAGGSYVPLDTSWPIRRIRWILKSLGVPVLISDSSQVRTIHDLQWSLSELNDVIYPDVLSQVLPPEPLDEAAVRAFWDHVSDDADDPISAAGFVSSYTGEPFKWEEVDEYVNRVVDLAEPFLGEDKRVLEIGCGSGLIASAIAPRVAEYVALDPSEATQRRNDERAAADSERPQNVTWTTAFAHEISLLEQGEFDLIILASTVQFFPGPYYLSAVIDAGIELLSADGAMVIADLMDPRRKAEFRTSLQQFALQQGVGTDPAMKTRLDAELYVDEDFFGELPDRRADVNVETSHRTSGFDNELGYRYDVVVRKRPAGAAGERASRGRHKTAWTRFHLEQCATDNLTSAATANDIAYVIYTSGSTGEPKGVVVQHRPVANLIDWVNKTYDVGPDDRVLWVTSPCFDLSVYDVFGVLAAGGSVRVASETDLRDPHRLFEILQEEPITFWDSAPAALQQLAPLFRPPDPDSPVPALRLVFLSGDWIPLSLPDAVKDAFPAAAVVALGGATEAAIWSNHFDVEEVSDQWVSIPYGRPIQNARYYVLDPQLHPCPVGVPGDLYIGGFCLCLGYAKDPGLTASKFIPDPFSPEPGMRLYGSGDRARLFDDGNIEFLGRLDDQVKIRGYRIETGEIEAVLGQHPLVESAVVVAREDVPGDKRLVAYLTAPSGVEPEARALRGFLREQLPEYMVPSAFVCLKSFPVTPNGKLDREALPAPDAGANTSSEAFVTPETQGEQTIANAWEEVLHVEEVGLHDNFFDLGGHSLLLIKVHLLLTESFSEELSIIDLFQFPTVQSLAEHLAAIETTTAASTDPEPAAEDGATQRRLNMRRSAIRRSRKLRTQQRVAATDHEA